MSISIKTFDFSSLDYHCPKHKKCKFRIEFTKWDDLKRVRCKQKSVIKSDYFSLRSIYSIRGLFYSDFLLFFSILNQFIYIYSLEYKICIWTGAKDVDNDNDDDDDDFTRHFTVTVVGLLEGKLFARYLPRNYFAI